jgi:chromosome partitioning protein
MYDIVPSGLNLYHLEDELMNLTRKYFLLKKALQNSNYEFVIIDCPPSFSFYTLNVLCATDSVLITMNLDVLSLQGLNQILSLIDEIKGEANKNLEVNGVLCVNVDERKQLTHEVVDIVKNIKVPLYETYIRTNVKAAEAPSFGVSVIEYAPDSNSAKDYNTFCDEFLESLTVNNN